MNPSLTLDLGIYENGFGIKKSTWPDKKGKTSIINRQCGSLLYTRISIKPSSRLRIYTHALAWRTLMTALCTISSFNVPQPFIFLTLNYLDYPFLFLSKWKQIRRHVHHILGECWGHFGRAQEFACTNNLCAAVRFLTYVVGGCVSFSADRLQHLLLCSYLITVTIKRKCRKESPKLTCMLSAFKWWRVLAAVKKSHYIFNVAPDGCNALLQCVTCNILHHLYTLG